MSTIVVTRYLQITHFAGWKIIDSTLDCVRPGKTVGCLVEKLRMRVDKMAEHRRAVRHRI
jgi:hypothetical protein